jgi:hypothetical protein
MSKPEPKPVPRGEIVPEKLITIIDEMKEIEIIGSKEHQEKTRSYLDQISDLIRARDAFGRQKYGQPLMTLDGRNGVEDCRQEVGDMLQYFLKCSLTVSKEELEELRMLCVTSVAVLNYIVNSSNN